MDLLVYFLSQERLGRGQSIHGVRYFVITEGDRERLPELGRSYAIALEELTTTSGKVQHWLIPSEAAFDEEVLLALSSVGLATTD